MIVIRPFYQIEPFYEAVSMFLKKFPQFEIVGTYVKCAHVKHFLLLLFFQD